MRKITVFTTLILAFAAFSTADAQVRDRRLAVAQTPAINQLTYGPDQCLYRFTGRGWSAVGLCHRWVKSNMAYLMMTARPGVIHSVLYYVGGRVVRIDDLSTRRQVWFNPDGTVRGTRPMSPASGPVGPPPKEAVGYTGPARPGTQGVQTRTDCAPPPGYFAVGNPCWTAEQEMQREARQRAAAAGGRFTIPMAPPPSDMDPRLQDLLAQGNSAAIGVLLRPPCTASYDGCR